ncbi:MAG TPA: type II secretion system F family protein [Candidatus Brocadiia bacterium]|nr:type II secretion system F family protein [Candidatus Brocadiia bacterium]
MGGFLLYILIAGFTGFILAAIWMFLGAKGGALDLRVHRRIQNIGKEEIATDVPDMAELEEMESAKKQKRRKKKQQPIIKQDTYDEIASGSDSTKRRVKKPGFVRRLTLQLPQVGIPTKGETFLMILGGSAFVVALLTWLVLPDKSNVILPAIAGLFVILLPFIYVKIALSRRINKIQAQLADALDLIANSMRAGHGFNAAIQNVADEAPDPIGEEFQRLYDELAFGIQADECLRNLSERIPIMDVKFFVTAVIIQRETGGNLAEILDSIGETIRERFRIFGQIKTLTAQGRLSGWILGMLPFGIGLAIYVLNKPYMSLLINEEIGHKMILGGLVLQSIGGLLIRKIVTIKV